MKKILKWIGIVLLIIILLLGGYIYSIRGRLSLYKSIGEKYMEIAKNPPVINSIEELSTMESMDYKDVEYNNINGIVQTLDIYGPKKDIKGGSPVILYVHGGSWAYGDKSIPDVISPVLDSFRDEGFTIISTSYELMSGEEIFGKQISDVKDTIRWIHKNKENYGFNTKEIGVIGTSSGAHLALMATYTDDGEFKGDEDLAGFSSKVKYVVDFFGPTDLNTLDLSAGGGDINEAIKSAEEENKKEEVLNTYSPINYVGKNMPKTLIIHSKADKIVSYNNSVILYDKLQNTGNKVDMLTLETSNHDLSGVKDEEGLEIAMKMLKFIVRNSPL
ncbi:alpha/beta hydrolase [Clostridium gasigenes]|uniref:Triacylglycerol lipase n=1 Tax=Clostridium gasigenes TaxID=94869 RepID=A0A1H0M0M4_9CLOT|nr:alpha/beta hydrolase [Clostridium gasigenes]SDO73945.1 triacylglycerol lipase [Clostridium gasigenes]